MTSSIKNIAFIDGQNLHLGTSEEGWNIDFKRFRIYLQEKYKVDEAYYFLGFLKEEFQDLYENLQKAGFILVFKEHKENYCGKKKGNVDTDIVFEVMKKVVDENFQKVLIISGDGDYKKMIDYLIRKEKFLKILFPNQQSASSLYKKITQKYQANLVDIRRNIEYKKKEP